ncbi:MAG: hypothetical protein ACP5E9_07345 [Candidatus Methanospirareceae archaeon]
MKGERRRFWHGLLFAVLITVMAFVSGGCAPVAAYYGNSEELMVQVDPSSLSATLGVGQEATTTLTINNTGTAPFTFEIEESTPVLGTEFLILDHGKVKDFFENYSYDLVNESEYATLSTEELGRYRVVYLEPDWENYENLNLINLSTYVQLGGVAVINIAGNIGSVNNIDPAGTNYDRSQTNNHPTILLPSHPYITGQPYGGCVLATSDFSSWGATDHGWLTDYPASSKVVLRNTVGSSWLQYPYGSGQVIVTTLTYGWGTGGGRGQPLENLIEYALHLSGIPWLEETPVNGTVAAGALQQVTITFNASGLVPGVYNGTLNLNITNSTATTTVSVPVTLNVVEFGLSPSTKDVNMPTANPGSRLTYSLVVSNVDVSPISATLMDAIPEDTTYVAGSVTGGATYNATENRIEWNGTVPADGAHPVTFQVDLDAPLLDGAVIVNTVHIEDLTNTISHWLQIPTDIEAPILTESYKLVAPSIVNPGDTITFTIFVFNTGSVDATGVTLEDPIPERATYVADSVTGGAAYNASDNSIEWTGTISSNGSHTITFQVTVNPTTLGLPIINQATLSHPWAYTTQEYVQVTVLSGADVLIVEDDHTGTNRRDIYGDALEANGYSSYDFFSADYVGTPSITTLQSYPVVIWYTGTAWNLNTPARDVITEYLTTGGRLFITGQDIAQQAKDSEFLNDTLHVRFVDDTPRSSYTKEVAGTPDEILATIFTTVVSYDPDIIEPADASAVPIIEYTGTANGTAGIRFTENTSRVVFLAFEFEAVTIEEDRNELMGCIMDWLFPEGTLTVFDTKEGSYPSISGTHHGTMRPYHDIAVSTLYTYSCAGAGGHTEYIKIWNTTDWNVTATWNGYTSDWHNLSFNNSFTLYANQTYNYTIRTGSYPQIIHEPSWNATGGVITCSEFVDINGKRHEDGWIPAIRLY